MKELLIHLFLLASRIAVYYLIINWQGWNTAFLVLGLDILSRLDAIRKANQ